MDRRGNGSRRHRRCLCGHSAGQPCWPFPSGGVGTAGSWIDVGRRRPRLPSSVGLNARKERASAHSHRLNPGPGSARGILWTRDGTHTCLLAMRHDRPELHVVRLRGRGRGPDRRHDVAGVGLGVRWPCASSVRSSCCAWACSANTSAGSMRRPSTVRSVSSRRTASTASIAQTSSSWSSRSLTACQVHRCKAQLRPCSLSSDARVRSVSTRTTPCATSGADVPLTT